MNQPFILGRSLVYSRAKNWTLWVEGILCLLIFATIYFVNCDKSSDPEPDPDLKFVSIPDTQTELAMILENRDHEKIAVTADKNSSGEIVTVTGGGYTDSDGNLYSFWFGSNGLPEYVVVNDWMLRLYNYTDNSVDIIGIDPQGNWNHWLDVSVDSEVIDSLQQIMRRAPIGKHLPDLDSQKLSAISLPYDVTSWSEVADILRGVSLGLSISCCVVGIVTSPTGVGAVVAVACCAGSIVGTAAALSGDDFLGGSSLAISTFTCGLGDGGGCASVGLELIAEGIDNAEEERNQRSSMTDFRCRLTLTWGENPRDLDSHLWTPEINNYDYHVYFGSRGNEDASPYAELDVDDVSSYGPENITITRFFSGTYYYSVYHYSGSGTVSTSGANVKVYGPTGNLLHSLNVPSVNSGSNWWWNVLKINGSTGAITIVNQISAYPHSGISAMGKLNSNMPAKPVHE